MCRETYYNQFIYKKTKQLYWNHTSAWVFSCKFTAYFQKNTSGRLLLNLTDVNYFAKKDPTCGSLLNLLSLIIINLIIINIIISLIINLASYPKIREDVLKSIRSQTFFKTSVLQNFAIFTGNHSRWSLFLIKLQVWRPGSSEFLSMPYFKHSDYRL